MMSNYEMKHLREVRFIEIKNTCLALGIDSDSFEANFFDWFKSSPLSGSMALDMCKTRLLAGLPMPWEATVVSHRMPLPEPPELIVVNGACAGCGLPPDGDHAPWCRTLKNTGE